MSLCERLLLLGCFAFIGWFVGLSTLTPKRFPSVKGSETTLVTVTLTGLIDEPGRYHYHKGKPYCDIAPSLPQKLLHKPAKLKIK